MEGSPKRLRHHLRRPNPPHRQLEMPTAVTPNLGQSRVIPGWLALLPSRMSRVPFRYRWGTECFGRESLPGRAAMRTDSNSSKATGGEFLQSLPALGHESAESPMTMLIKRVETTLISYDCHPIQISLCPRHAVDHWATEYQTISRPGLSSQ